MAQREGYRARAAYKLKEIDEQDHLIKAGSVLVDLGSAPGSWCQYARNRLVDLGKQNPLIADGKPDGTIIAIDMLGMEEIADVQFLQGDFRDESVLWQLEEALPGGSVITDRRVSLVLSDMAPNLSGVGMADAARIQIVIELALEFALMHLKPEGALIVKAFHGSGFSQVVESFKRHFKRVVERKPKASRDRSSETFLIAKGLKK